MWGKRKLWKTTGIEKSEKNFIVHWKMAGVLFVVCIPREKYEKCISNKQQSSEEDGFCDAKPKLNESLTSLSDQVKDPVKLDKNIN